MLGAPGGRTPGTRRRQLLAIESPLPRSHFMLRLLEPRGSCPDELWVRLRAGTYDKPFVLDKGLRRMLHFDFGATQSAMLLSAPHRLLLAYTREMMTFLLFNPDPKRILLLGLGGGSIAKYCYRHLPCAEITAVEISADVIALREMFSIPADDQRFRVVRDDGVAFVAAPGVRMDVILADACDRSGIAAQFDSTEFYRNVRNALAPGGIFITNVCGEEDTCTDHLLKLRDAFDSNVLTLAMGRNIIAFAFKDQQPDWSGTEMAAQAVDLKRRYGINFPKYSKRLLQISDHELLGVD